MKYLKMVFRVMVIVFSIIVILISAYKIYTMIKEKWQATEVLKYASDVTIDEEKEFAKNLNYLNAVNEYRAKKYDSAILELNEEIKKYPKHAQAYYLLGKIYEDAIFDDGVYYYSKMAKSYDKYIAIKPRGKRINDAKLKAAQYYISIGLNQKAPQYLDKAENYLKTLDQSDSAVRMSLGAIYLDKQSYEQAITSFEKSTNFSISEIKLKYNSLGLAYMKRGDYAKAENAFEIAIKINPQDKYAQNNLGVAYVKQGKLIAAQHQFLETLKLDPEYRKAQINKIWTDEEIRRKKVIR
jgi:tetratricopeptide (TPR) repeat protein